MDAILQMRPSMKYLDEADVKKKNSRKVIEDEDMVDVENDDERGGGSRIPGNPEETASSDGRGEEA